MGHTRKFLALAATASFAFAACSGGGASTRPAVRPRQQHRALPQAHRSAGASAAALDEVRLQLQWAPQAQFAGYFAAQEQGYYEAAGLKVTMLDGGPDVIPQAVGSAADGPEFTISWVPKVLQAREGTPASDLVDIAQVFQRSGTLSVSWKDSNITTPADFKGKKVGAWGFGNEFEVTAGCQEGRAEPRAPTTPRSSRRRHDAAPLEADRCRRGDDLQRIRAGPRGQEPGDWRAQQADRPQRHQLQRRRDGDAPGRAVRTRFLAGPGRSRGHRGRFLKASFQGWIYCRANPADCVQYTVNAGSTLGAGHQAWMMNEINPLVWPSPNGIGMMDPAEWQQSVDVALAAGIIKAAPPAEAYRTDLATAALAGDHRRHQGRRLQEGRSPGHGGRQLGCSSDLADTKGRPARVGPSDSGVGSGGVLCRKHVPPRHRAASSTISPAIGTRLLTSGLGRAQRLDPGELQGGPQQIHAWRARQTDVSLRRSDANGQ